MVVALILAAIFGAIGWMRAARRGGTQADKLQYALAHGFAAFVVGMVGMTVAGHMGLLG
ncbi:MAG: hypothetical protein AAFV19_00945 [Pseudomonadota bacterium]